MDWSHDRMTSQPAVAGRPDTRPPARRDPGHRRQDRYSRLRLISWWRQERLRAARVLVVGAGALGNEV